MNINNLTIGYTNEGLRIGSDPEFFIRHKETNEVIPAFTFLPNKSRNATLFYDGFQAEFITNSSTCIEVFTNQTYDRLRKLNEAAKKVNGYISFEDSIDIPNINKYSPEQTMLGCSPSLNAYGESPSIDSNSSSLAYRTAGSHVHVGSSPHVHITKDIEELSQHIREVEQIGGIVITSLMEGLETPRRRQMYGRAGEFRQKDYGFEYRVPPPGILIHPIVMHLAYDMIKNVSFVLTKSKRHNLDIYKDIQKAIKHSQEDARSIINACDYKEARKAIRKSKVLYENIFKYLYYRDYDRALRFVLKGALSKFSPEKYEEYWRLNLSPDGNNLEYYMPTLAEERYIGKTNISVKTNTML